MRWIVGIALVMLFLHWRYRRAARRVTHHPPERNSPERNSAGRSLKAAENRWPHRAGQHREEQRESPCLPREAGAAPASESKGCTSPTAKKND